MKRTGLTIILIALFVSGCAAERAFKEGEKLMREGKPEAGLQQLETAMKAEPDNLQYRATYIRNREAHINRLLVRAESDLREDRLDEAAAAFREVLGLHPENARAPAGLASVEMLRRNQTLIAEAETALRQNDAELARGKLRSVLAQDPNQARAIALMQQAEEKSGRPGIAEPARLAPGFRRNVTLEFRDAPLRSIFDALSRQSGLNFIFDKDVRTDTRATTFARDTAIADALDMLLATSQLAKKVLNANTLLIYPNQPQKQKEYEELVVRSFFLANTDAKSALTMVKTLTKIRDAYVDEKLNLLFVRDTPEAIRLVEKIIQVADQPEPEVMLDVEILEVKRSRLMELGVQWPTQLTALNIASVNVGTVQNGTTVVTTPTQVAQQLTLETLKGMDGSQIGVSPNPAVNMRKEDSDVNILANPRIRVKNREKAKIHIGDKVPVITSNTTATGVVSESVSYLDVGLKLDVEPQVHLDGDVAMKVGLEVSNIVKEIRSGTGTLTYQLGSRNASTVLRLKDNETQVLAGLISDEERSGASKLPGLGDIPLLGRLFSSHRDDKNKTEIVLLITPRILRNVERPALVQSEFFAGTEGTLSDRPLRLRAPELAPAPAPVPAPAVVRPAAPPPVSLPDGLVEEAGGTDNTGQGDTP